MGHHKLGRSQFSGLTLQKFYSEDADDINTWELTISNRSANILDDIMITGIQNAQGKCYTQPLLFPGYIRCSSPLATIHTCVDLALEEDDSFLQDYTTALHRKVHKYQELQFALIEQERNRLCRKGKKHCNFLLAFEALPHHEFIQANTPINSIKSATKW